MAKSRRDDQHSGTLDALNEAPDGGVVGVPPSGAQVDTPRGPARVDLDLPAGGTRCLLIIGHGAGGSVDSPDLVAVRDAVVPAGVAVARVTQPYRVAGRRSPAPANHLDEAWTAVVRELRAQVPMIFGGRSSGARVACRTAGDLGAVAIVALAFPLHPPGKPEKSRAEELLSGVPTLVVNGDRDPFGIPEPSPGVEVRVVPGDHSLKREPAVVGAHVLSWLRTQGLAEPPS
jgi:predicted alpha/beta-hydrolase family hydrolase